MTEEERQERLRQIQDRRAALQSQQASLQGDIAAWQNQESDAQTMASLDDWWREIEDRRALRRQDKLLSSIMNWHPSRENPSRAFAFMDNAGDTLLLGQGSRIRNWAWQQAWRDLPEEERPPALADAYMRRTLTEHPVSSMAGDITGYGAGIGLGGYRAGASGLTALGNTLKTVTPARSVLARAALGPGQASQALRYTGRLGGLAGIGAADAALYGATVDANNRAVMEDRDVGFGERMEMAGEYAADPLSWAALPGASILYSGLRGATTQGTNALMRGLGRQEPFKIPGFIPSNLRVDPGNAMAPAAARERARLLDQGMDANAVDDVIDAEYTVLSPPAPARPRTADAGGGQQRVDYQPGTPVGQAGAGAGAEAVNPARRRQALRMFYDRLKKEGLSTDDIREIVNRLHYGGNSDVPEMMFELAGASNDQLAVALGTVGGRAKQIAEKLLPQRSASAPARIRQALQRAMGVEGSDYYSMQDDLYNRRLNEPRQGYQEAYGREVSDETWTDTILPLFRTEEVMRQALDDAISYSSGLANRQVREQLQGLKKYLNDWLKADDAARAAMGPPPKLTTQALDHVDRMLGDIAEGLRSGTGRSELARGPTRVQDELRGVASRDEAAGGRPVYGERGLDPETGLNVPRDKSAELRAAGGLGGPELRGISTEGALQWGRRAFTANKSLEEMIRAYADQIQRYGKENIGAALLVGWMRGAEDAIEKATNPGTLIRQLYGNERQRAKMLELLPTGEGLSRGQKAAQTKRMNVLLGDGNRPGIFERERAMFDNQQRIIKGAQSTPRAEAVKAQGGLQNTVDQIAGLLVRTPRDLAAGALREASRRATMPGIYQGEVNEELGKILFASGREDLLAILDEVDALIAGGAGRGDDVTRAAGLMIDRFGGNQTRDMIAGALAGGALGASGPDDISTEERVKRALAGAVIGGVAGAASRRGRKDPSVSAREAGFIRPQALTENAAGAGLGAAGGAAYGQFSDPLSPEEREQYTLLQNQINRILTTEGWTADEEMKSRLARLMDEVKPLEDRLTPEARMRRTLQMAGAGALAGGASQAAGRSLTRNRPARRLSLQPGEPLGNARAFNQQGHRILQSFIDAREDLSRTLLRDRRAAMRPGSRVETIDTNLAENVRRSLLELENGHVGMRAILADQPYKPGIESLLRTHELAVDDALAALKQGDIDEYFSRLEAARHAADNVMGFGQEIDDLPLGGNVVDVYPQPGRRPIPGPDRPATRTTAAGVEVPTDDRRLYDFTQPLYAPVPWDKLRQRGQVFDQTLAQLPGEALPSKSPRPVRNLSAADTDVVWLADSPESASRLAGYASPGAPVRTPEAGRSAQTGQPLELVGRSGEEASLVVEAGTMSNDELAAEVQRLLALPDVTRVRVKVKAHTINGVRVPERDLIAVRRGDLRSPDAAFAPSMTGRPGVMAGFGGANSILASTGTGGILGMMAPADSYEERIKNGLKGAAIGGVAGAFKSALIPQRSGRRGGGNTRQRPPMERRLLEGVDLTPEPSSGRMATADEFRVAMEDASDEVEREVSYMYANYMNPSEFSSREAYHDLLEKLARDRLHRQGLRTSGMAGLAGAAGLGTLLAASNLAEQRSQEQALRRGMSARQ